MHWTFWGKKSKKCVRTLNGHLNIYARGPAHGHYMPVVCPSAFPRDKGSGRWKILANFRQRRPISACHKILLTGQFCPSLRLTGIFCPSPTPMGQICLSNNDRPILPVTCTDGHIRHPHWQAKSACQVIVEPNVPVLWTERQIMSVTYWNANSIWSFATLRVLYTKQEAGHKLTNLS